MIYTPVLITWSTREEDPDPAPVDFAGGPLLTLGTAGSAAVPSDASPHVYVSGQVSLNAPVLADAAAVNEPAIYGELQLRRRE